jgi:hypothetical protein
VLSTPTFCTFCPSTRTPRRAGARNGDGASASTAGSAKDGVRTRRGYCAGHYPVPHSAFDGQTPDEVYFGTGADVPDALGARKEDARQARMRLNRSRQCATSA